MAHYQGDDKFLTSDLALAAVLHVEGYEDTSLDIDHGRGVWHFTLPADPDRAASFRRLVGAYHARTHTVEPRLYLSCLSEVRRNLYVVLNSAGPVR